MPVTPVCVQHAHGHGGQRPENVLFHHPGRGAGGLASGSYSSSLQCSLAFFLAQLKVWGSGQTEYTGATSVALTLFRRNGKVQDLLLWYPFSNKDPQDLQYGVLSHVLTLASLQGVSLPWVLVPREHHAVLHYRSHDRSYLFSGSQLLQPQHKCLELSASMPGTFPPFPMSNLKLLATVIIHMVW